VVGNNKDGQLGLGNQEPCINWTCSIESGVLNVAGGYGHTVAYVNNYFDRIGDIQYEGNNLFVTGNNEYGQLGLENNDNKNIWTRVPVSIFNNVSMVACGENNTVVVSNNMIHSTGQNNSGELGLGDTYDRNQFYTTNLPSNLPSNYKITSISCGQNFTSCIISKRLYVTGNNANGQLGFDKKTRPYLTKWTSPISALTGSIKFVSCGGKHMLGIVSSSIFSYGYNVYGQLGYPNN
jgi:alpha-tubulin suppressor-like RCC1 family protein